MTNWIRGVRKPLPFLAGMVVALVHFNANAGDLLEGLSTVSAYGVAYSLHEPVATISGASEGSAASVVGAATWSIKQLSGLTKWVVTGIEHVGTNARMRLTNTDGKQQVDVTLPAETVRLHSVEQGQTLVIEKKTPEVALLRKSGGETVAVLTDYEGARQHSASRVAP